MDAAVAGGASPLCATCGHQAKRRPPPPPTLTSVSGLAVRSAAPTQAVALAATLEESGPGFAVDSDAVLKEEYLPGSRMLSHYTVVRQLGRGGMGTVYLARDEVSGQEVAVKVLPAALAKERDIRERFVEEARALAALDHENIVPLVSYVQSDHDRYLVMKYVAGESLDTRIRRLGVLPFEECRIVLRALLSALDAAHQRGVIHRDVKPSNVILSGELLGSHRIVLVDFGIAKKSEGAPRLTQAGMLMGTPQYMSPEQIAGEPIDGRADLYAAGLVLFEMLCGKPPFDSDKTFDILRAHVETPVPDLEAIRQEPIPPALLALVYRLLAKDPGDRPTTGAVARALLDSDDPDVIAPGGLFSRRRQSDVPSAVALSHAVPSTVVQRPRRSLVLVPAVAVFVVAMVAAWLVADAQKTAASMASVAAVSPIPVADAVRQEAPGPTLGAVRLEAAQVWLTKAQAHVARGAFADARVMIDAALEAHAENAAARALRADLLVKAGELDAADEELARARAIATVDAETRGQLEATQQALQLARDAVAAEQKKKDRRARQLPPSKQTAAALAAVTATTRQQMQRCYDDEVARKSPRAYGEVAIEVRVPASGIPDKVVVDAPAALTKGRFAACVRDAAKAWRFAPFVGAAETVRHSIRFQPR